MPEPDGNPAATPTDGGTPPAAPAPADNNPADPAAGEQPAAPPRTIDPVKPGDKPADGQDPNNQADPDAAAEGEPNPDENPDGDGEDTDKTDPTLEDLTGEESGDEISDAIQAFEGDLPEGVNPDGTIDPLVYAYENMPVIEVRGKVGAKGEIKTYQVKTTDDLPDDFRFASGKDQAKFSADVARNMQVAGEYINDANSFNAQRKSELAFQERATAQRNEITALQEQGLLPKFAVEATDANFMQDPGAQRVQQVLDYMKEYNAELAKSGVSDQITSIRIGLQLLEAKELQDKNQARSGAIHGQRMQVNNAVSGGGSTPAAATTPGNEQRVHRNVSDAVQAGLRRAGNLNN